jgi:heme-degrading monooxygenase HmoA
MYVRITNVMGASDIDGGLALLRDQVLPQLQQQKGFQGFSVSGDRSAGVVTVLSVWDTEADLDASESTAEKARSDAVRVTGGQLGVERYEQNIWEVGDIPPGPGAKLHIRPIKMDPARIDDNLEFFRQNILPQIKGTPGFLGVRHLINRSTGEGRVGTLWADDDSLAASQANLEQFRAGAAGRGVEFGEDRVLEILLTSMQP